MNLKELAKSFNYLQEDKEMEPIKVIPMEDHLEGWEFYLTTPEQVKDYHAGEEVQVTGTTPAGDHYHIVKGDGYHKLVDDTAGISGMESEDDLMENYEVVTKDIWDQMDKKQREDALLTIFKDPDDITDDMLNGSWEDVTDNDTGAGHFNTGLDMQVQEGTCGFAPDGKIDVHNTDKMKPAGPDLVRKYIQREIKKMMEEPNEGNAYIDAMRKAKDAGEDEFEVDGETHKVK